LREYIKISKKFLTLGIAFACNIGGIGTPIGSPPNAITLGLLRQNQVEMSFSNWMLFALPLMIILLMILFVILYFFYPLKNINCKTFPFKKNPRLNKDAYLTLGVTTAIIIFWLTVSPPRYFRSVVRPFRRCAICRSKIDRC
jgi:sodium-dependent dicarboxylate transporter 2/3/5